MNPLALLPAVIRSFPLAVFVLLICAHSLDAAQTPGALDPSFESGSTVEPTPTPGLRRERDGGS